MYKKLLKRTTGLFLATVIVFTGNGAIGAQAATKVISSTAEYDITLKKTNAYSYVSYGTKADLSVDCTAYYYDGKGNKQSKNANYSMNTTQVGVSFSPPTGLSFFAANSTYKVNTTQWTQQKSI